jgi:hypothetical protein
MNIVHKMVVDNNSTYYKVVEEDENYYYCEFVMFEDNDE